MTLGQSDWQPLNASPRRGDAVSRLVFELAKLPGIGEKTATRLAYYILKQEEGFARGLSEAILAAKQKIGLCTECTTFTDQEVCPICANSERNAEVLCVVERPSDVLTLEQSGIHKGLYHVLHGVLSPLDGVGPDDLKIRELLLRLQKLPVKEVILAMNPTVEGEATGLYLGRLIKPAGIRVTQLAHGIPVGGQLEYTDRQTLGRALQNRVEVG
jgi:recombination protein RecR